MVFTKFIIGRNLIQKNILSKVRRFYCCKVSNDNGGKDQMATEGDRLDSSKKGLVIGVYEAGNEFELTPTAAEIDQKSGGKLCHHLNELSRELKLGKAFVVTDVLPEYSGLAIASYGKKDAAFCKLEDLDQGRENVRWGVGAGVRALQDRGCLHVQVDTAAVPDAAAEAAVLAAWRFQEYKSQEERGSEPAVSAHGGDCDAWREGGVGARAQNWARCMADSPANMMTPVDLAQEALDVLCPLGVRVDVRDSGWLAAQRMRAILHVAKGSAAPPLFLECRYSGAASASDSASSGQSASHEHGSGDHSSALLVAKGVTFDSGGLCLKRPRAMRDSRGGMAGAAVCLAALRMLAELKVPINVHLCIPLCENMVSGQSMKPGDVVPALNGLSIQIEDTDMEGRLLMADALVYGQAVSHPRLVLDVATLTDGVQLATGGGAFGCFSNSAAAWQLVRAAGARTGDRGWRLPLWRYYRRQLTDDPAVDLRNKGSGKATPCIGAAFLSNFVCGEWVHLDTTGVGAAGAGAPPYLRPRRQTARPVRTVAEALRNMLLPDQQAA